MRIRIEWKSGFMELDYDAFMKLQKSNQKQFNKLMQFANENGGWRLI